MTGCIWLIAEDENDKEVLDALLKARGIDVTTRLLNPTRQGSITRLSKDIDKLIATALEKRGPNDCIAVLHDADQFVQTDRNPHKRIKQVCDKHRQDVVLVIACDEIESWLLADTGLCKWLGVKPKNCDHEAQPSNRLKSLVNKKGIKYSGQKRAKALSHVAGDGDQHSPSMQGALQHLDNAPCISP